MDYLHKFGPRGNEHQIHNAKCSKIYSDFLADFDYSKYIPSETFYFLWSYPLYALKQYNNGVNTKPKH